MRFLLRADAGVEMGTGHVMRCVTLGEELVARGHQVVLRGSLGGIEWLARHVSASGVSHESAAPEQLDSERTAEENWDAIVIDSYWIPPASISALAERVPVLAVIDGDDREITATRYVDQNLGADSIAHSSAVLSRLLAGTRYALVRRAVRDLRRIDRWQLPPHPRVLAFMGGSDPLGSIRSIATSLRDLPSTVSLTLISASPWRDEVASILDGRPGSEVLAPTADLPGLLASADVVVSATGTSAGDICTMGIPAVFVAIVENQQPGLRSILDADIALGVDAAADPGALAETRALVERVLDNEHERRARVERALDAYDGLGAVRLADELEIMATRG